ncbi:electron transport complex subunit RsxC [Vogesella sp. GCM10023246]|uniref:Ion-translocating oxidoreductase complex subunit C n=1 Tax=Vogesella oryzagri TaxID=3160864 RepID=A0ABV1M7R0_9NEIS
MTSTIPARITQQLPFAISQLPLLRQLFNSVQQRGHWRGGVRLRGHKQLSNHTPIRSLPLAGQELAIPLSHGRSSAQPCVQVGQRVCKGEVIGDGPAGTVWAHASTSGVVTAIKECCPADGDQRQAAVYIAADGLDEWAPACRPTTVLTPASLAAFAMQMGLVGLGGAGFPTGLKLQGASPDTLLINGAECEPFLTCDDRLMRERAGEIVAAAALLASVFAIGRVRIGIEPNKPQAIAALWQAAVGSDCHIEVLTLPLRYPAGGQPLLIKSLTGRTLAPGKLPAEVGVMVLNVATVYALGRAVLHGRPLVSRIVTISGAVAQPGNVEAPIGLPVASVLAAAQAQGDGSVHIGGPMMGRKLADARAVISKTTSGLLVQAEAFLPAAQASRPCIRCNRCVDACPMSLRPLHLLAACQQQDRPALQQEQLGACIECGACSHVCPSKLPLRDSFRQAKRTIWLGVRS